MSTAATWPGFTAVSDQRQIDRQTAQLADHFEAGPLAGGGERLTDDQLEKYRALALEQSERHDRHAQVHQRYADGHRARGERLAEEAAPVETTIVFGAAGPELVERRVPAAAPDDERIGLAEAAVRAKTDVGMVLVSLGVPPEDGYRVADVDRLAQDR